MKKIIFTLLLTGGLFMNTYGLSENIGSKEVVPLDVENVEEEGEKDA